VWGGGVEVGGGAIRVQSVCGAQALFLAFATAASSAQVASYKANQPLLHTRSPLLSKHKRAAHSFQITHRSGPLLSNHKRSPLPSTHRSSPHRSGPPITKREARRTGDHGGVAGVVLGDVLLHLAHQVGADVGRLGVDPAAHAAEEGDGGAAQAVAGDRLEEALPVVAVELVAFGFGGLVGGGLVSMLMVVCGASALLLKSRARTEDLSAACRTISQ